MRVQNNLMSIYTQGESMLLTLAIVIISGWLLASIIGTLAYFAAEPKQSSR